MHIDFILFLTFLFVEEFDRLATTSHLIRERKKPIQLEKSFVIQNKMLNQGRKQKKIEYLIIYI